MSAKGTHLLQRDYVRGGSIHLIAGEWGVAWHGRATRLAKSRLSRADNGVLQGLTVMCTMQYPGSMRALRKVTGQALGERWLL